MRNFVYSMISFVIMGSLASGWLLTGKLMPLHQALQVAADYGQRGAAPTWQRIQCIKAWDSAANRSQCGGGEALASKN